MADYFPLIARAVAGLDKNTGENRRVLYDRARSALVNQLRGVEPPLNEPDITRERLALEEAIRRVEADAARQSWPDAADLGVGPPSIADQGMHGFRDSVAEADGLGGAAAEATRAARDVYDAVPGDHPRHPLEGDRDNGPPYFEPPGAEARSGTPSQEFPDERMDEPGHGRSAPPPQHFSAEETYARPARSYGGIVKLALLLLVLGGLAGGAYWERNAITRMVVSLRSSPASTHQQAAAPAGQPKITDRVGPSNGGANPATAPAAAVAQKVVLFDEDPGDPKGKRYVGSALWRTETVSPGSGLAPELAVRADVEIPERHVRLTWSLRRNSDKALPASHTIEIIFTLPSDFPDGGIANVPGVLMKSNEQARGVPLAGLAVKVTNGYFLIGLSAVDVDVQRNIQMLKNENWLDIPIVYTNGKRGILEIEKGTPGARVFEEAFRAWGE
ncbi:MAG TPA: hypothetical protein VHV56_06030 [Pseudolabrys sp.]|nr:hypothetical protein [Pseudolabrys sp.]